MTKHELSHDEAFAALDALALDALEGEERDAVLAHVSWCDVCRPELRRLRTAAASLAYAAPLAVGVNTKGRDRVRARLMARATTEAANREIVRRTPPSQMVIDEPPPIKPASITDLRTWRRPEWIAAAACILFAATAFPLGYTLYDRHNLRDALQNEVAFNQQTVSHSDSLKRVIMARDSMINGLIGRDVLIMRLTAAGARAPFAMMFWDRSRNAWTFSAHNMPQPPAGRTYQLWLVTATAKISAGTFDPKDGDAVVRATYALPPNALKGIAVTEENAGGAAQPTTPPIIAVTATQ